MSNDQTSIHQSDLTNLFGEADVPVNTSVIDDSVANHDEPVLIVKIAGVNNAINSSGSGTMIVNGQAYTPAYCSPEQKTGGNLTRRTDIWSWAVSVLEMFMGERLWQDGTIAGYACEEY